MKYHVLPGDATVSQFNESRVQGDVIVCRECLIVGDVDYDSLADFWDRRASFILGEYGDDAIDYHEKVADELARLGDLKAGDQTNLWFEYELFCNTNMWFCIWLMQDSEADIYRVMPSVLPEDEIWKGFGGLSGDEMRKCYESRVKFSPDDIRLGAGLWNAYRRHDHSRLAKLAETNSPCFPYLREVVQAEIEKETRPKQILDVIESEGITDFNEVFPEFTRRAGIYGFGDSQVREILERS